jgi:DNA invertase Pin-like site-specific DNA recombinase
VRAQRRKLLRERQREGISLAKQAGKYLGRKRALTTERADELRKRAAKGESNQDWRESLKSAGIHSIDIFVLPLHER